MDAEYCLSRAAECLFSSVRSAEPREQHAMVELAQVWLQRSERDRISSNQSSGIAKQHRPTQVATRKGLRRKKLRRADPAGAVGARGARRQRPGKKDRSR